MKTTMFAVVAAAALLAGSAASASVWVATYTGTVYRGYDATGVFGPAGSSLDGDTFTAKYTYDTAVGIRSTTPFHDDVYGGTYYGAPSPVSATLTINGVTQAVAGSYSAFAENETSLVQHDVIDYSESGNINSQFYNFAYPAGATPNLETSLPLTSAGGLGGFTLYYSTNAYTQYAYGGFSTETVQIGPGSAPGIPEPAAWALTLAGIGGVGAAMRTARRRDGMASATA